MNHFAPFGRFARGRAGPARVIFSTEVDTSLADLNQDDCSLSRSIFTRKRCERRFRRAVSPNGARVAVDAMTESFPGCRCGAEYE
ncbi:hypothetical protein JZ751_008542 [Albula glossodonta]|uniref:Uncharacterized protein n=1 Tax=Albula glossodonta TaxID=121402 RepID=A0A8T2N256_9TELE|nr:hypothetical protein JZ751_008542 [Albula glossodonta]